MPKSAAAQWLAGDTTYQQQLANYLKSRTDYQSQYENQRDITTRDYRDTLRSMNRQADQDRDDLKNDFGGRGVLRSGVFAESLGDYNTEYNSKVENLQTGKTDKLEDLAMQRTNFLRQLALEKQAARQDALRRRAAELGI